MSGTVPHKALLERLLQETARRHRHLCPRQVLGVRLGLCGLRALGLAGEQGRARFDNEEKRLLTICETDGCGMDGVAVATDCAAGRRTLRVLDFGKVAATLVDTGRGEAVRVSPSPHSRQLAQEQANDARSRWHAYLNAYQHIPDEELIVVQRVALLQSVSEIISHPDARAVCDQCGEEIMNEREVIRGERTLCRSCAGERYYRVL